MPPLSSLRSFARQRADPDHAALRVRSCLDLCNWNKTPVERRGEPLFACRGCGSQWVPSEHWTPRDASGHIPPEVVALLRAED